VDSPWRRNCASLAARPMRFSTRLLRWRNAIGPSGRTLAGCVPHPCQCPVGRGFEWSLEAIPRPRPSKLGSARSGVVDLHGSPFLRSASVAAHGARPDAVGAERALISWPPPGCVGARTFILASRADGRGIQLRSRAAPRVVSRAVSFYGLTWELVLPSEGLTRDVSREVSEDEWAAQCPGGVASVLRRRNRALRVSNVARPGQACSHNKRTGMTDSVWMGGRNAAHGYRACRCGIHAALRNAVHGVEEGCPGFRAGIRVLLLQERGRRNGSSGCALPGVPWNRLVSIRSPSS
jgi:hypothetical protein